MSDAPIAVFDSGVGGLSILQALRRQLPQENFVYFADTLNAPYGEKDEQWVTDRTQQIAHELLAQGSKALVVACNTATAAAIAALRTRWPEVPIVGIEPAIKPAVAVSKTGCIGVLATQRTLASAKFKNAVADHLPASTQLRTQAATGLAWAIEVGNPTQITALIAQHLLALAPFGQGPGQVDTLVLGCTHYPFVSGQIQAVAGPEVTIVDNGPAVARQTQAVLQRHHLLNTNPDGGRVEFQASNQLEALQDFAHREGI